MLSTQLLELASPASPLDWVGLVSLVALGWVGLGWTWVHPLHGSFIGTEVGVRWILPEAT